MVSPVRLSDERQNPLDGHPFSGRREENLATDVRPRPSCSSPRQIRRQGGAIAGGNDDEHTTDVPGDLKPQPPRLGPRPHLDRVLHGGTRLQRGPHRVAADAARPACRPCVPAVDGQRLRHRLRRRHHHRRRARRPVREAPDLQHRPGAVHPRLGRMRPRPQHRRADRRAHRAGPRRRRRHAAQPDHLDQRISAAAARADRRDLRWPRGAGRRGRPAGRRRGHRGPGLALDLLAQRPDRPGRDRPCAPAAPGKSRRAAAARPDRCHTRHGRRRRDRMGTGARERRRLVKPGDPRRAAGRIPRCCSRSSPGRTGPPSPWFRCGCSATGPSPSATSPRSSCPAPSSPPRS